MDTMQQMSNATQGMQQTGQAIQIINSYPNGRQTGDPGEVVCTVQTNCAFAYFIVYIFIPVIVLGMIYGCMPVHKWYHSWKKKQSDKQ
jgi:hypothetical protein